MCRGRAVRGHGPLRTRQAEPEMVRERERHRCGAHASNPVANVRAARKLKLGRPHGNVWALNRLVEVRFIARKAAAGSGLSEGCKAQWTTLVEKSCPPSAPFALRQEERMERLLRELQRCIDVPAQALQEVTLVSNGAQSLVRKAQRGREKRSRDSWRQWKAQQSTAGGEGGVLFHFVQRTHEYPDITQTVWQAGLWQQRVW